MNTKRQTAGEISKKLSQDTTRYDASEIGHAMAEGIDEHLYQAVANYKDIIDEDEFCVVMLVGKDNLIQNVIRRKFYCWPFLPKPRPNQAVFLYNKNIDNIQKRLWVLPSDMVMAELASLGPVHKRYKTMQAWSKAFFDGKFWDYIRQEHSIDMLSEHEYFLKHRDEFIKSGGNLTDGPCIEEFDFSKIQLKNVIDTKDLVHS